MDKHRELSPAIKGAGGSAPATVLGVELSVKPNKSVKTKVSNLFDAVGLANFSCDPKIGFSRKVRWPRRVFHDFSVSGFYYKG